MKGWLYSRGVVRKRCKLAISNHRPQDVDICPAARDLSVQFFQLAWKQRGNDRAQPECHN